MFSSYVYVMWVWKATVWLLEVLFLSHTHTHAESCFFTHVTNNLYDETIEKGKDILI